MGLPNKRHEEELLCPNVNNMGKTRQERFRDILVHLPEIHKLAYVTTPTTVKLLLTSAALMLATVRAQGTRSVVESQPRECVRKFVSTLQQSPACTHDVTSQDMRIHLRLETHFPVSLWHILIFSTVVFGNNILGGTQTGR